MDASAEDKEFMTIDVNEEVFDNTSGEYDNKTYALDDESSPRADTLEVTGGPISGRDGSSSRRRRYAKRNESHPNERDGDEDHPDGFRTARSAIEMKAMDGARRASHDGQNRGQEPITRHRRTKSQYHNGYQHYRQMQKLVNTGFEPDPDYDSDSGDELTLEDIKRTRQFLATIRVRSKSRKKRSSLKAVNGASPDVTLALGDDGDQEEEYEEQVGLPSARQKRPGLAQRVQMAKQLDSVSAVAKEYHYKDQVWELSFDHRGRRKASIFKQAALYVKNWTADISYNINFWSQHFKEIEGRFGMAVTTYFRFTRWLVKVNFMVFFLFLCFLYIPKFIVFVKPSKDLFVEESKPNASIFNMYINQAFTCSSSYIKYLKNVTNTEGIAVVLDAITGTGKLEDTFLFYGQYKNLTVSYESDEDIIGNFSTNYNMGLAYMMTMICSFFLVFVMIVLKSSKFIQEFVIDLEKSSVSTYSNAVFSGWDYCIDSEKTAYYKQKIIFNTFQAKLEELLLKRHSHKPTPKEITVLYLKRGFINFIVLVILAGSFASIYFTTVFLLETQEEDLSSIVSTLVEFLPSIIITVLNFVVPNIFLLLVTKEEYKPSTSSNITILRAVFLRISLVGVLIVSLYYRLQAERNRVTFPCPEENIANTTSKCCGNALWISGSGASGQKGSVRCWETYVGQQFYKLAIADIFNVCLINLTAAASRKLIVSKFHDTWWASLLGLYAFDLPVEVLDLVYTQTLCWVGMFFSPLLPLITLLKMMVFFFVKKFILLRLCEPPKNIYRASRSYSFFQVVLLGAFAIICIFLGYMIGNIQPSKSCGPFRVYSRSDYVMFDSFTDEVDTWPEIPKGIFNFLGTVGFFLPTFIVLLLAIYYYWAVSRGYKHMEEILHNQIKSEAHDKQFLLARVDEIIKQNDMYKDEEW